VFADAHWRTQHESAAPEAAAHRVQSRSIVSDCGCPARADHRSGRPPLRTLNKLSFTSRFNPPGFSRELTPSICVGEDPPLLSRWTAIPDPPTTLPVLMSALARRHPETVSRESAVSTNPSVRIWPSRAVQTLMLFRASPQREGSVRPCEEKCCYESRRQLTT